jgi:hypothetical protein
LYKEKLAGLMLYFRQALGLELRPCALMRSARAGAPAWQAAGTHWMPAAMVEDPGLQR